MCLHFIVRNVCTFHCTQCLYISLYIMFVSEIYKHCIQWNVETLRTMKCTNITYSEMYKHCIQWNVQTLCTVKCTNIAYNVQTLRTMKCTNIMYNEMYKHYVQWNVQTLCTISLYAMFVHCMQCLYISLYIMFVHFIVRNVCTFRCT